MCGHHMHLPGTMFYRTRSASLDTCIRNIRTFPALDEKNSIAHLQLFRDARST